MMLITGASGRFAQRTAQLDFDIVPSMRERTPLPASLINRLPRLRMLGITGAHSASLDTPACTAQGILPRYPRACGADC